MRGAGLPSMEQGTLALIVVLLLGGTPVRADNEYPSCTRLAELTHSNQRQCVSVLWQPMNISMYWRSEESRAAAALLASLLRYSYGCRRLRLRPVDGDSSKNRLDIQISWKAAKDNRFLKGSGSEATARPRRLHAWLSPAARSLHICQNTTWTSYANETMLALCGFINVSALNHEYKESPMEVFGVGEDCNSTMQQLQQLASDSGLPANPRFLSHTELVQKMQSANKSFLFLDYDVWKAEPSVRAVLLPPRVHHHGNHKLDSAIDINIAVFKMVQENAPHLFQFIQDFKPTRETLRQILEQEANGVDIEEAVCNSTLTNRSYFIHYTMAIYLCYNDPDGIYYDNVFHIMIEKINRAMRRYTCDISIRKFLTNCSDSYDMSRRLHNLMIDGHNIIGVVSQTVEGAEMASIAANMYQVPLVLVDVVPENSLTKLAETTWRVAGRSHHIVLVIQHFILELGWNRIALLSEPTKLAKYYLFGFLDSKKFWVHDFKIPLNLTEREAKEALQNLRLTTVRVVFLNVDSDAAAVILAAAVELNMSDTDGFVWITRDWRPKNVTGSRHFTASFWNRVDKGLFTSAPLVTSLADAMLTLSEGFTNVFRQYPNTQYGLHNAHVIRLFNDSLIKSPVVGINGLLHYKERAIEDTLVYIDEWCGGEFKKRLVTWRVNATDGAVIDLHGAAARYTPSDDMPRKDGTPAVAVPRPTDLPHDNDIPRFPRRPTTLRSDDASPRPNDLSRYVDVQSSAERGGGYAMSGKGIFPQVDRVLAASLSLIHVVLLCLTFWEFMTL